MLQKSLALVVLLGCGTPSSRPVAGPLAEHWCIRKMSDESNNLVFITINLAYRAYPSKANYPYLAQVNITTVDQNANGHPTDAEAVVLNRVEDGITAELNGLFIGRATTKGGRELMYMVGDADKANAALTRMSSGPHERAWEFRISKDPDWARVQPLLDDDAPCL